jgi:hypothetical protein
MPASRLRLLGQLAALAVLVQFWISASIGQEGTAPYGASYSTNWGNVTFQRQGAPLIGTYPTDDGRIVGTLRDQVLSGYWTESSSSRECASDRDGTRYWGRLELRFNVDHSFFSGPWGYCDGMSDGTWSGTLTDPTLGGACGELIAKRDRLDAAFRDLMDRKLPEELLRELASVLRQIREAITGTQGDAEEAADKINEVAETTSGLADGVVGILQRIAKEAIEVLEIAEEVTAFFDDIIPELESWADRLERAETADAAATIRELRAWFDELRERLAIDKVPGLGQLLEQYSNAMGAAADDAGRWEQRVTEYDQLFREIAGRSLYMKARPVREQLADARRAAMAALEDANAELDQKDCLKLPADPGICEIPHSHIDRVLTAALEATAQARSDLSELHRVHARLKRDEVRAWEAMFALEARISRMTEQISNSTPAERQRLRDQIRTEEAALSESVARAKQASELSLRWSDDINRLRQDVHRQTERKLGQTPWTQNDLLYLEHCLDEKYVPARE